MWMPRLRLGRAACPALVWFASAPEFCDVTPGRNPAHELDGFDELGSQAWSNDSEKLRAIRAKSLERGMPDYRVRSGSVSQDFAHRAA
jgi:hypothetical protein